MVFLKGSDPAKKYREQQRVYKQKCRNDGKVGGHKRSTNIKENKINSNNSTNKSTSKHLSTKELRTGVICAGIPISGTKITDLSTFDEAFQHLQSLKVCIICLL